MKLLITGGAGFIGVNAAFTLTRRGHEVIVFDNLSRDGSNRNLIWLQKHYPKIEFIRSDVRDYEDVESAVRGVDGVIHLAAQVAVTSSLSDPLSDFEINVKGTLNVLEAIRKVNPMALLIYASTNKVYGNLVDGNTPVAETSPLDFHTPYGVSKGSADQYVHDYSRCYGLKTAVLRQSCIYGRNQFGTEDQGWVAHFVHSILVQSPLTIYGDGTQVRDLLNVDDVVDLYEVVLSKLAQSPVATGLVYNVGGGPKNARNLLEVIASIESLTQIKADYSFAKTREGDQTYFVADVSKLKNELNWEPSIDFESGLASLVEWASTLGVANTLSSVS